MSVLMRRRVIGLFLLFAASAICFAQEGPSPQGNSSVDEPIKADDPRAIKAHDDIQALMLRMIDRWNAHDLAGYMEGAWKSKDFLMVIDAEEIRGWAEAFATYQRGYPDPNTMGNVVCDRLETQLIKTDVALAVMRWTLYLKGGKVLGTSSLVVRQFSDGWKVVSDHSTTLEP
jgi:hypothetical protein